jgi:hypothetical protein
MLKDLKTIGMLMKLMTVGMKSRKTLGMLTNLKTSGRWHRCLLAGGHSVTLHWHKPAVQPALDP